MGAATEAVTVQPQPNALPRTERISRKVKRAIDMMVMDGLHRADAAKKAGIAEHSLYVAMRKPSVLAYRNTLLGVLRTSAAARTIAKAEQLMDKAESEHVQADMVKYLGQMDADVVPNQTRNPLGVNANTPGLTVNFIIGGSAGPVVQQIDGQSHQVGLLSDISGLPARVPHPSERNALPAAPQEVIPPGKSRGRK